MQTKTWKQQVMKKTGQTLQNFHPFIHTLSLFIYLLICSVSGWLVLVWIWSVVGQ